MAVRPAEDVLGISKPLLVDLISSAALAFGEVVPMPTFCAIINSLQNKNSTVRTKFLII